MSQEIPSHDRVKEIVVSALTAEATVPSDRTGESEYDRASDLLAELSRLGVSGEIVDVLIEVGAEGRDQVVDWWLRFLSLFDSVRQLSTADRIRISEALLGTPPDAPVARAYVLRFLAYSACPVEWDSLPDSYGIDVIAKAAPLELADAYVWAERFEEAADQVTSYLKGGGNKEYVESMLDRWTDLEGANVRSDFIETVRRLLGRSVPTFDEVAAFGRDMRQLASTYKDDLVDA